jgi:hypothetical protein
MGGHGKGEAAMLRHVVMTMVALALVVTGAEASSGQKGRRVERKSAQGERARGEARGRAAAERPAWYERGQHVERFNAAARGEAPRVRQVETKKADPPPTPRLEPRGPRR